MLQINKNIKSVLLTNSNLVDFGGSEINTYTLALTLKKYGIEVCVATLRYENPIRELFESSNIKVVNAISEEFEKKEYDLIWAHHTPILYKCLYEKGISSRKIIFSSLSSFEPLETAPVFGNELTLFLANSEETKKKLNEEGIEKGNIQVFPNYVTQEYFNEYNEYVENNCNQLLKIVCIVSNHVPDELLRVKELLEKDNIIVDIYGIGHKVSFITSEILKQYDCVITIGKTVQYCFGMGKPVYCYDIHGGPGWITKENIELARYHNFSGRGFKKYLPEEIYTHLINDYKNQMSNIKYLFEYAKLNFDIDKNLMTIFEIIDKKDDLDLNTLLNKFKMLDRANKYYIREYEYNNYRLSELIKSNSLNKQLNEEKEALIKQIDEEISEHQILSNKLEETTKQYENCRNSLNDKNRQVDKMLKELEIKKEQIEVALNLIDEKNNQIDENLKMIDEKNNQIDENLKLIEQTEKSLVKMSKVNSDLNVQIYDMKQEIEQKEKNCQYLFELSQEKMNELNHIYDSKAWKLVTFYRKIKHKLIKVIKDPTLIYKKFTRYKINKKSVKNQESKKIESFNITENVKDISPLVTVVIPIYDRTDVLIESIESILSQTFQDFELILVCDGSPKSTIDIVKSYESNEKIRIFYYKNNSGNAVRGRNKAIKEARGKYLAFQDSDDVADSNRLKISIEYMEKYNADVVYGGWRALIDGSRNIDLKDKQEVFSPDSDYEMLKEICVPCQSTVMAKVDALRRVGGLKTKMRYREDHELWARLAYFGYKFKSIQEVLTNLRLHANNLELQFKENDDHWYRMLLEEHTKIEPLKPKVGYVVAGCDISGGLAVICQHVNRLLQRGHDVILITESENTSIDWYPNQLVEVINVKHVPDNMDILVATYWTTAYTVNSLQAKRKLYFVQSDESRFFDKGTNEYKAAFNTYKLDFEYITMAKWLKKWLYESFNKEASYIRNGVDNNIIYPVEPMIPKGEKIRVLLEGPIDVPFKGMEDAFNVVKDVDCEVWCVSSAGKPKLEWKCDKFFEKVPMEQMKYIYSSCDILIKMSKVESFALPPLEMMYCGGTCIICEFTGQDEYIVDGYNAIVVQKGDVKAAQIALQKLIDNPDLLKEMKENSKKTAENWGWESSINELEKIILS